MHTRSHDDSCVSGDTGLSSSTPATALVTMRASGLAASSAMPLSDAIRSAAAPSFRPDELPAVTEPLPSVRNAGFNLASVSRFVSGRRNSSCSKRFGSPFFCGISTGVISLLNRPAERAFAAFCCQRTANAS